MKVIGISGYARCGKDTFVEIAKDILRRNGYSPFRVAFADKLREEVQHMLGTYEFKTSVYTDDTAEKTINRPLCVWWGCQRRTESPDGGYWIRMVDEKIRQYEDSSTRCGIDTDKMVFLVSDVRFKNEAEWVKNKWNGSVIHLKRWTLTEQVSPEGFIDLYKKYDEAPNAEEAKNDPLVIEIADHHAEWENLKLRSTATLSPELKAVVLKSLNEVKYFNGVLK